MAASREKVHVQEVDQTTKGKLQATDESGFCQVGEGFANFSWKNLMDAL